MVVLEAMAAGVPVVAAKVGGVPDLIQEGQTGIFFDPLDAESIRSAIERTLTDPGIAKHLATNALESARQRFQPRSIAQRHLSIYHEVLSLR